MCVVLLKDGKIITYFVLGLKDTVDQLAMANSVHWYGDVLSREDGYVSRRALWFVVKVNGGNGSQNDMEERLEVGFSSEK